MEKKKNIVVVSILVVIILVICFCGIFISDKESSQQQTMNNQIEPNNKVAENGITKLNIIQNVEGLEFSNVEIQMKTDWDCELRAEVLNTSDKMIEARTIRIKVTDDIGELNEVFAGNISSIPVGEKRILSSTIRKNLTSATNVKFEIIE